MDALDAEEDAICPEEETWIGVDLEEELLLSERLTMGCQRLYEDAVDRAKVKEACQIVRAVLPTAYIDNSPRILSKLVPTLHRPNSARHAPDTRERSDRLSIDCTQIVSARSTSPSFAQKGSPRSLSPSAKMSPRSLSPSAKISPSSSVTATPSSSSFATPSRDRFSSPLRSKMMLPTLKSLQEVEPRGRTGVRAEESTVLSPSSRSFSVPGRYTSGELRKGLPVAVSPASPGYNISPVGTRSRMKPADTDQVREAAMKFLRTHQDPNSPSSGGSTRANSPNAHTPMLQGLAVDLSDGENSSTQNSTRANTPNSVAPLWASPLPRQGSEPQAADSGHGDHRQKRASSQPCSTRSDSKVFERLTTSVAASQRSAVVRPITRKVMDKARAVLLCGRLHDDCQDRARRREEHRLREEEKFASDLQALVRKFHDPEKYNDEVFSRLHEEFENREKKKHRHSAEVRRRNQKSDTFHGSGQKVNVFERLHFEASVIADKKDMWHQMEALKQDFEVVRRHQSAQNF